MKKETNFKTEFFKKLTEVCSNFNKSGVKEMNTIALVYQVAFKAIENSGKLELPIQYRYTSIDFPKNVLEKHSEDVHHCAGLLLQAICEAEPFTDLMTQYVEEIEATNKNLAQFFSPSDISNMIGQFTTQSFKLEQFNDVEYTVIADPTGCGAGSLVLGQLRALRDIKGFKEEHYQSVSVYMNDLDEDLHRIAFFQVLLSSLAHAIPLGKIEVENKNIITDYDKKTNSLLFIANYQREAKIILRKMFSKIQQVEY